MQTSKYFISKDKDSVYKSWNITHLGYTAYDPELFWERIDKCDQGLPIPPLMDSNYARAIAICTIQEINKKFSESQTDKLGFQEDLLIIVVRDVSKYYEKHPYDFFAIIKNKPVSKAEKIKQHSAIRGLARMRLESKRKPFTNRIEKDQKNRIQPYDDADTDKEMTQDDVIDRAYYAQHYAIKTEDMTQFDENIISAKLDQATITQESDDIISQFFLQNQQQIQSIIPYFQNKVLLGLNPKSLWKVKVFEWKASEVYGFLEKIDIGDELDPNEKGYLYMFYLMVCIAALHQKWQSSVQAAGPSSMLIGKKHIPTLTTLVLKTFLHFTKNLYKNVFSNFEDPPPVSDSDVKAFGNVIKDKPRNLLKAIKVPLTSIPKPKPVTKKASKIFSDDDLFDLPETFNLEEAFESYEVFESLTQSIMDSFLEGKIKDDPVLGSGEEKLTGILLRLPKFPINASENEILEAVTGPWRVSKDKLDKIKYIFPVVAGRALDVCKLEKSAPDPSGRWSFKCTMANDEIRAKYKGRDFTDLFPKGSQNVIKYVSIES